MLRSLLSENEVRTTLRQHFVCTWVLKDDLARDQKLTSGADFPTDSRDAGNREDAGDAGRDHGGVSRHGGVGGGVVDGGVEVVKSRLAAALLGAASELAQIIVLSPAAFQAALAASSHPSLHPGADTGREAVPPPLSPASAQGAAEDGSDAEAVDAEAAEGDDGFLRIYTETGRNAAFDRTLFGFLAFLHTSRDGEAKAGGG